MSIPRDIQEFLDGYPTNIDDRSKTANIDFYRDKRRCLPDNLLISEIHEQWKGEYEKLEYNHGFIQWLFPIREHGMNYQSQPLQAHELASMKADPDVIERIIISYRLMLDFYGMQLVSVETGLVDRTATPTNYAVRYNNLVRSTHNNLRISRILKCLSELGLERLNAGFLLHVLCEQSESKELNSTSIRGSMDRWWVNCIKSMEEREWLGNLIQKVRRGVDGFVFTRDLYVQALKRRQETGSFIA